ncbi:hypothetical protein KEM52_005726 [Ascosphaera acerosa]|nr:hypothetical protein KEM52_005726 [Ascosphaera acerosa]
MAAPKLDSQYGEKDFARDNVNPTDLDAGSGTYAASDTETGHVDEIQASKGRFGHLLRRTRQLGIDIEERGIEPVRPDERTDTSADGFYDGFAIWASANITPATFAIGTLGPLSGLGFWDSFLVIVIVDALTALIVAWIGHLGVQTGMRVMTIGRYSMGIWGGRVVIILQVCGQIGWSAVNSLSGAQVLTELSNGDCPLWAGNLIIGVCAAFICVVGYRAVRLFERWSWAVALFSFIFVARYGAKYFDAGVAPMPTGEVEAQNILSFIGSCYSFLIPWACYAADYYVRLPETTSKYKLGAAIWLGIFFGAGVTQILGAAFMTAVTKFPEFALAYEEREIGGLLGQALIPIHGFGKFLLVLLALSVIACNLVNLYSMAFMCQNFHPSFVKVPRFVWSFVGAAIAMGISIGGEDNFETVLESVLSLIGYYGTAFVICMASEHYLFRRRYYPLQHWNDMTRLPLGVAGVSAVAMGFAGAILTMHQKWFTGPISKAIEPTNPELGWLFSAIFSFCTFIPLRWLEIRLFRR